MKKTGLTLILIFTINICRVYSQEISGYQIGNGFSIIPTVNYISSATIQLYPYSEDFFERTLTEELSGDFGYGITIKKSLFKQELSFAISAEYINLLDDKLTQVLTIDSTRAKVNASEEIWMVPVEFTGYFNLPDFDENLKIYLGGGVGIYFGDRKRKISNIESKTISKSPGASFVILSGMEYFFNNKLSSVFEMRFRQGEFTINNEYPVSYLVINGNVFPINKNLNSRVFVDGIKLSFGIAYHF